MLHDYNIRKICDVVVHFCRKFTFLLVLDIKLLVLLIKMQSGKFFYHGCIVRFVIVRGSTAVHKHL